MPPEYHLQSFWEGRFKIESHFEWLGDGQNTLVPHLRTYLRSQLDANRTSTPDPPRLLHIGAGTSSLCDRIRDTYRDVYGEEVDESAIVNVDFSETAVQKGVEAEMVLLGQESTGRGMRWVQADVLKWDDLAPLRSSSKVDAGETDDQSEGPFDVVLEKSTTDAISCGEDIFLGDPSSSACHPALKEYLAAHTGTGETFKIHPVDLLALHLASLVRPGGIWIALSFSSNRFPFLGSSEGERATKTAGGLDPASYWSLQERAAVEAPTGNDKPDIHVPVIHHYVYVLCRTGVRFGS